MEFFPKELIHLLYVTVLSFLVGLELRAYRVGKGTNQRIHMGSMRTFTFIGIIGYLFYQIDLWFYIAGFVGMIALYMLYYFHKLQEERASIISFLLVCLVYAMGPSIEIFDFWMPTLIFVLIVFILGANQSLRPIFENLETKEFETLGKFLLLSAVILPLLPKTPIPVLGISAFKIWLVVVVISGISYGSYISQKYLFKNRGYFVTGIFGGLYSSTATTVVLAKKCDTAPIGLINASIVIATAMMYIRLLIIAYIFNQEVARILTLPMLALFGIGVVIAMILYKREKEMMSAPIDDRNPLELWTAFVFAALFVFMIVLTNFVVSHYGNVGLQFLSFVIGFTDIDPFVLSLLTKHYSVTSFDIATAILIASGSNDILKAIYAIIFGNNRPKVAAMWLLVLGILTIASPKILEITRNFL